MIRKWKNKVKKSKKRMIWRKKPLLNLQRNLVSSNLLRRKKSLKYMISLNKSSQCRILLKFMMGLRN